jgi:lysophospholipid acyltransferase (LPLAT)-like uncharacterized protein
VTTDQSWRSSRVKRAEVAAIAAVGYPIFATLGLTFRWQVRGMEHFEGIRDRGHQPIMAFWHGRILPAMCYFRRRGIVVITSENFDGEWIGRIIERFGYRTARGSSSRGARRALLQLKREMENGRPVGFALDGPRGPGFRAQPGAVWLARVTGNPLLPFHLEAARHWTVRSWDRAQIPQPFSRVALTIGAPIAVPADADDEMVEQKRVALEEALRNLQRDALDMLEETRPPSAERQGHPPTS